jgi:hypothetical protein
MKKSRLFGALDASFMTTPIASGWSKIAGWFSHSLENAA